MTANAEPTTPDDLIDAPVSIMVASCGAAGRPHVARAVGCRRRGIALRVLLQPSTAASLLADLRDSGRIAVVFTEVLSHRSLQVKGHDARVEAATAGDAEHARAWAQGHARHVRGDEASPASLEAVVQALLRPGAGDLVAVVFTPSQRFEQTPGPAAGRAL